MKLYVYDHCPFCVRARMPLGLKALDADLVFLPNDDEDTPNRLIGKKILPVLEDAEGAMGESLDIVHRLDGLGGPRLFDGTPDPRIEAWLKDWGKPIFDLVIPRTPDPVFPEFRGESARAYFIERKQAVFGHFPDLLDRTEALIEELTPGLEALVAILPDPTRPGIDDILLFPFLRCLTQVEELTLPAPVRAYAEAMAERTGVPLVDQLRAAQAALA